MSGETQTMDLPAHFWSRRSDSNRGRRSPRPPSAYSSRATAQHTWGSPQVQVFQQECQRSRMLHKHFERNWTSRLPPRGDYSPRSLARQLAPTPVDTLALAAPFTNLGELTLPRSPPAGHRFDRQNQEMPKRSTLQTPSAFPGAGDRTRTDDLRITSSKACVLWPHPPLPAAHFRGFLKDPASPFHPLSPTVTSRGVAL